MNPGREGGSSLLEVVVVLGLLSVILLIAGRLIVASRRMEASASRVAAGPRLGPLAVQLRRDLESAVGAPFSGGGWSSLILPLSLAGGSGVRYDLDGGNLLRTETRPDGSTRTRVVVRGLRSFRWRSLRGRAVDVRVTFAAPALRESSRVRGTGAVWWVRVAPRGGRRRRW